MPLFKSKTDHPGSAPLPNPRLLSTNHKVYEYKIIFLLQPSKFLDIKSASLKISIPLKSASKKMHIPKFKQTIRKQNRNRKMAKKGEKGR